MSVPKLRFPEFSDAGEWEEKKLGDIAPLQRGFDLPTYNLETGSIPVVYSNGIQNYHKEGMAKAPELVTGRSGTIGKLHFIEAGDYWPHNTALWVTSFKHNIPKFVYFLYLVIGMERFASGSGVPTLNRNYVHAFETCIPLLPEQKKIADCLSSLDDRITAETQKLDTLKAHKKGLMQQLFPAEGETMPKLRFPEFQDAGEWEEKELGEISRKIMVGIASAATHAYRKSGIILFRNQNIKEGYLDDSDILFIDEDYEKLHKSKRLKSGDLLTARTGYPGTTCVVPEKYEGSQSFTTLITRPNNSIVNSEYLCIFINSEKGQAFFNSTKIGGGQKNVNAGSLVVMPILYPSHQEQQKIADCLISIDEAISLQSQAIDLLKLHKKGLMQQLFPSVEEVRR
ncbi:MAG: restriction endonuclease subunit S [Pseudanabaena sp. 42896M_M3]|jgi:type I restriction enzyme S subunit|nr:restriction endonuclease subunit S [Pseudanabaena sp. 42896M_M3]